MEAFQSRQTFHYQPSFDYCLEPYKVFARELPAGGKLTERQHTVASHYGFSDWQSFQFFLKELHGDLSGIELSADQWGYIYDVVNGWGVSLHDSAHLLTNVIDADRYDGLGGKWFDELSKAWEDDEGEHYEPSPAMREFIVKLQALTEREIIAVVMKGLTFWQATFLSRRDI